MGCYEIRWKESAKKELKNLDKMLIKAFDKCYWIID